MVPAEGVGLGGFLRLVEIVAADQGAADHDLAPLAGGQKGAVVAHDGHPDRVGGLATAAQPLRMIAPRGGRGDLGRQPSHHHRRLDLAVALAEAWPEHLDRPRELLRRHGRADQHEPAQAGIVVAPQRGVVQQPIERGGRAVEVGDLVPLDIDQHLAGVEAGHDHLGRAKAQGGRGHGPGGVGQGRGGQADRRGVVDLQRPGGDAEHGPPTEVGDVHPLGRPGRAAGGKDAHDLVWIAEGVAVVDEIGRRHALQPAVERSIAVPRPIEADRQSQASFRLQPGGVLGEAGVIEQHLGAHIVHVGQVGVQGVAGVDRDPDVAGAPEAQ